MDLVHRCDVGMGFDDNIWPCESEMTLRVPSTSSRPVPRLFSRGVVVATVAVLAILAVALYYVSPIADRVGHGPPSGAPFFALGPAAGFVGSNSTLGCGIGHECYHFSIESSSPEVTFANTTFSTTDQNGTIVAEPKAVVTFVVNNMTPGQFVLAKGAWENYSSLNTSLTAGDSLVFDSGTLWFPNAKYLVFEAQVSTSSSTHTTSVQL
jgi:hypothetical protein